ncbi:MAG: hypothetical protein WC154_04220 [Candidatus Izemoplasmatales bacterium]
MKKVLCLVLLCATLLFSSIYSNHVLAYIPDDVIFDELGDYVITEPTMETIKVYINSDMVDIIEETGVNVYTSEIRHYFLGIYIYSTYKYYHYVEKYVENIITQRSIYNDIDSLIFILNELDNFAHEYSACQGDEMNCVLGFIRSTSITHMQIHQLYMVGNGHY